jgi:uncharacterized protein YajQ (UPF0234 family)
MQQLIQVVNEKLARRSVPLKNVHATDIEIGGLGRARVTMNLQNGIDQETAKIIQKDIKGGGFKKAQVQIQGEELRVTSPSRDELQEIMASLRAKDYGVELLFGNYR